MQTTDVRILTCYLAYTGDSKLNIRQWRCKSKTSHDHERLFFGIDTVVNQGASIVSNHAAADDDVSFMSIWTGKRATCRESVNMQDKRKALICETEPGEFRRMQSEFEIEDRRDLL